MKVLFLSQGRKVEDHPGWDWSLRRLKEEGVVEDYLNIPWQGYGETYGWNAFYEHVVNVARDGKFDIVYFHYFHRKDVPSPASCMQKLKSFAKVPTIIISVGDGFSDNWMLPWYPQNFRTSCRFADIVYSTQMGRAARKMIGWGAKRVVYTPNSMCPVRFSAKSINPASHRFDYDVVMIGSRNGGWRNPFNKFTWMVRDRRRIVEMLSCHFGERFAIFGKGWDGLVSNRGPVDFSRQQEVFQRGRIVVGGNPYSYSDYYSSNRLFFEIASGVPTVELRVPRLEKVLRGGEQVYFCDRIEDIISMCEKLLKTNPGELYGRAAQAAQYIAEHHTQYHRMKFKLETAFAFHRTGKLNVAFPFFLPEVNLADEEKFAMHIQA